MNGWTQMMKANEPADFLAALVLVLLVWLGLALARNFGARSLSRFAPHARVPWSDMLSDTVRATSLILLLPVALYAGVSALDVPARLGRFVQLAAVLALLAQAGLWANRLIALWMERRLDPSRHSAPEGATAVSLLGVAARIALWSLVVLAALDQLDFDITALVAGLGIGGVAVALAVQNILGDLFASLSIVLDKPFVVGDFVVVDGLRGTVERVGIKSTRIRSLDGELMVFSNADLLKSRIRNFKRMMERRVTFSLGVVYRTPLPKVRAIPGMLREIVESRPNTRFDRAHFKEYGDSALVFEIVYYVLSPDYNTYMDVQQDINLSIYERFARSGIEFAYPTRTLVLERPAAAAEGGIKLERAG